MLLSRTIRTPYVFGDVETRCRKEVVQVADAAYGLWQLPWAEIEFPFIMRINQP